MQIRWWLVDWKEGGNEKSLNASASYYVFTRSDSHVRGKGISVGFLFCFVSAMVTSSAFHWTGFRYNINANDSLVLCMHNNWAGNTIKVCFVFLILNFP